MKKIKGGVTKPQGFQANGLFCGIKKSGKLDLGLIYAEEPCVSAAVFTKNSVKAAPVIVSQKHARNGQLQAVIVNSGNANCFTGKFGMIYAQQTAEIFGKLLGISKTDVLVASTGIIGRPLPFDCIKESAETLVKGLSKTGSQKVADAILTTDLIRKEAAVEIEIGGKKVVVAGCAKGSGMIQPNMATMLGFVTTDVAIEKTLLKKALVAATEDSFNSITVDGCMSTNDMLSVMASGKAGNKPIATEGKEYQAFCEALNYVCLELAKKIVLDGEGATKFIEVFVCGAKTKKMARQVAMAIANSNLVKTADYTDNPNWGRVMAAAGSLGIKGIDEDHLKMSFVSKKKSVVIHVDLNLGREEATCYTSDLTKGYIEINGKYN